MKSGDLVEVVENYSFVWKQEHYTLRRGVTGYLVGLDSYSFDRVFIQVSHEKVYPIPKDNIRKIKEKKK